MNDRIGALRASARLDLGAFVLDLGAGELFTVDGRIASLRKQALQVLLALGSRPGVVVTKETLLDEVWPGVVVGDGSLAQAIADIRRVLGDGEHRFVRNVARRGYMLVPNLPPSSSPPSFEEMSAPQPEAPARPPRGVVAAGAAVTALLIAGLAVVTWLFAARATQDVRAPALSIVLLPLVDRSAEGDNGWFIDALGHDLTTELGRLSGTFVISRETAAAHRNSAIDPRTIAKQLGVRYVVQGAVRRQGDRVRLDLSMVDGMSGAVRWSDGFELDRARLQAALVDVVGQLARSLSVQMHRASGDAAAGLADHQVRADDLAMQGFNFIFRGLTPQNAEEARERFEAALRQDPRSLRAWAGVATVAGQTGSLNWMPREAAIARLEEAAQHLHQLDQDDYYTGMSRSFIAFLKGDWENQLVVATLLAERFKSHPYPHHARAYALAALGRFDECIVSARRAMRIGPRDYAAAVYQYMAGMCHFMQGDYREAATLARAARESNPLLPSPPVLLAVALARMGQHDEARQIIAEYSKRNPAYKASSIGTFLRGSDPRFIAGRDLAIATLRELGLP